WGVWGGGVARGGGGGGGGGFSGPFFWGGGGGGGGGGAPPPAAFLRLNGTLFAGFAAVFTAGLRRGYPELDRVLRAHLDARYLGWLAETETTATFPLLYRFARRDIDKHCGEGITAMIAQDGLQRILEDIHPGRQAPAMPMLVLQGVYDEVIAVADVDGHVARYVEAGVHVRYLRDRLSTHLLLQFLALPVMVDWLAGRFAGRELPAAGTRTSWSLALAGPALSGHLRFAALLVRMWLGRPIRAPRRPALSRPRPLSVLSAALRNPLS
ncbi:lipase family protein, partial [Nocardia abscessus]|uniref:lipase family protein n=1 Tax=Nocardia abscessus TaxID=120957 RepID=UPI0024542E28